MLAGGSTEGKGGRWRPHPTGVGGYNEKCREPTREAGGAGGRADSGCAREESVGVGERRGGAVGDAGGMVCGFRIVSVGVMGGSVGRNVEDMVMSCDVIVGRVSK